MRKMMRIILVGDPSPNVIAHAAIPKAISLATTLPYQLDWLPTADISSRTDLSGANAIWCVPGSPYMNMDGALLAIRHARESLLPFLGTCGGFQHALIEYARNILGIIDADHLESNPQAAAPVISKLSCGLVHQSESLTLTNHYQRIYGAKEITEEYQCNYGLNPAFRRRFEDSDLEFAAFNSAGEPRAFQLKNHPFFIGALFQPERSASSGRPHPLIAAFLQAAAI